MKKFLFLALSLAAFLVMGANIAKTSKIEPSNERKEDYRESWSDEENMRVARLIAAKTSPERVAVIGDENGVLIAIGIRAGEGKRSEIRAAAEEIAKEYFKGKIVVEVQSEKAEKIFSLASKLESGIPNRILKSRALYLLESD